MAGILLVSADMTLGGVCRQALRPGGHSLVCVRTSAEAFRAVLTFQFQAIVYDCRFGPNDDLLRWLQADRERASIPVLYLGAPATFDALVPPSAAFRPGVDAVLPRPFTAERFAEMVVALVGVARRRYPADQVRAGPFLVDVRRRTLALGQRSVPVTPIEGRLLRYLMERAGVPVAVEELLTSVWGYYPGTGGSEVVRAHVRNVRRKLESLAPGSDVLLTVPRVGYRFVGDAPGVPP